MVDILVVKTDIYSPGSILPVKFHTTLVNVQVRLHVQYGRKPLNITLSVHVRLDYNYANKSNNGRSFQTSKHRFN